MHIHEKYKIIQKKGFNPPFMVLNPEKWPKILIFRICLWIAVFDLVTKASEAIK